MSYTLARRYAKALSDLAQEAGNTAGVAESLDRFATCYEQHENLGEAFSSPHLGPEQRRKVLEDLGGKLFLDGMVLRTLCLLSDRRRLSLVPNLAKAFRALLEEEQHRIHAQVTSASQLSEAYVEQLQKVLEQVTGKKVVVTRTVDPSLLGGVVTRVGDKIFDGSLRTRLDELEEELLLN